ncbi:MAG: ATP-binding protein [Desulfobulbaceae bacterium]|nr:ATP-binding protein [Desulfobulbaceae bacterium]
MGHQIAHDMNLSLLTIVYSDLLNELDMVSQRLNELRNCNDDKIGYDTVQLAKLNEQAKMVLGEIRGVRARSAVVPVKEMQADYAKLLHEVNNGLNFINNSIAIFVFAFDKIEESYRDSGQDRPPLLREVLPLPMDKMCNSIQFGLKLVRGILCPVDEDAGEGWMQSTPVNMNEEIDAIIQLVEPLYGDKVIISRNYSELPLVTCDLHKIHQVLLNLTINSLHAMKRGGELCFSTFCSDDKVHISVKDNGEGIAPAVFAKIEQPFFTTKKAEQGMGLGLKISFAILRNHGGSMVVESEEGKGTKVTISLPFARRG